MGRGRPVRLFPDRDLMIAAPEDVILGKLWYFAEGGGDRHLRDADRVGPRPPSQPPRLQEANGRAGKELSAATREEVTSRGVNGLRVVKNQCGPVAFRLVGELDAVRASPASRINPWLSPPIALKLFSPSPSLTLMVANGFLSSGRRKHNRPDHDILSAIAINLTHQKVESSTSRPRVSPSGGACPDLRRIATMGGSPSRGPS